MRWPARALILAAAAAAVGCQDTPPLERYDLGGDLELTDQRGEAFSLADRRGEVLLLFFGFTSCPDACPTTMSRLSQVESRLSRPVEVLFVTVDPTHDDPARLADYARRWDFPVTGLTGPPGQISDVLARFGASSSPDAAGGFQHSTRVYLIDGDGRVRFLFGSDDPVERMARVIEQLL